MKNQGKNILTGVTIGGNYIGGNQINNYIVKEKETKKQVVNSNITVFLSYCRKNKEIADKIDTDLVKRGIEVKRDIRDIENWKSIRKFMESIRENQFAVLLISDEYLKSNNCMYEVLEVMKEREYENKIFPAVLEPKIYEPEERIEYIKYWEKQCEKQESKIQQIKLTNAIEAADDLKQMQKIANSMGEFLKLVSDKNNPNITEVVVAIETILKEKGFLK